MHVRTYMCLFICMALYGSMYNYNYDHLCAIFTAESVGRSVAQSITVLYSTNTRHDTPNLLLIVSQSRFIYFFDRI